MNNYVFKAEIYLTHLCFQLGNNIPLEIIKVGPYERTIKHFNDRNLN